MIVINRIASDRTAHRISIRGHELVTDMGLSGGGGDEGPDPHDLYDAAVGACKALTMVWYAQRKGIALEGVHVDMSRDASGEREGVYRLTARVAVTGSMSEEERARLIDVAGKCPVHKLMTQVRTEIETVAA